MITKCKKRNCKRFQGSIGEDLYGCEAFPAGIPDTIAFGDDLHILPYPGDNDLQFSPMTDEDKAKQKASDSLVQGGSPTVEE